MDTIIIGVYISSRLQTQNIKATRESVYKSVVENGERPEIPSWVDNRVRAVIESCWKPDPCDRPSMKEVSRW